MTAVFDLAACPECGTEWRDDGSELTRLIGVYDWGADRTVAWQCPACEHSWDRGATV
jgi:predicted RNA-binding Zn-ribbon protein involved in translation (DUF1610 family)